MTISEKILAKASGRKKVVPGEVIRAKPSFSTSNDFYTYPEWSGRLERIGVRKLKYPDRTVIVADHFIPYPERRWSENHKRLRDWANKFRVKFFYDGIGIGHQIMAEQGHALPGTFLVSDDSDCTVLGGLGCFSLGIGSSILEAYALGQVWVRVPPTIKVTLTGSLKKGVMVRDLAQKLIGDIGKDGALFSVIEFTGRPVAELSIDERMSLCSRVISAGADTAIVNPDIKTIDYAAKRAKAPFEPVISDPDATYLKSVTYDLSTMEPLLAVPPAPTNTQPLSKERGVQIDQAYIGSCAGGRLDELRVVAKILKNKKVHPRVKFIIVPPSVEILKGLEKEGLLTLFLSSGALLGTPGCSTCFGEHGWLLSDKEICISTVTSNLPGRMGSSEAKIYLGSPATVAASAVEGMIVDPRNYF